jgi:uncharacterized protein
MPGHMKILAVADLHGAQYRLNLVLKNIEMYCPDIVVVCGDITQFGPAQLATNLLNQVPVDTMAVPGNIDTPDVIRGIDESNATNLHLRRTVKQKMPFIGIGGVPEQPLSEVLIQDGKTKKPLGKLVTKDSIIVTHVPPYKLQDKVFIGSHGGNKELREIVDTYQPKLVLCGHIHEDPGVTISGNTTVVNCSMGKRTEGAIIELGSTVKVTILE